VPSSAVLSSKSPPRFPFLINDLAATMNPWVKTSGSTVQIRSYSTEGKRLRHFTSARSKRSVYRQSNKEVPINEYEASGCDLLIIDCTEIRPKFRGMVGQDEAVRKLRAYWSKLGFWLLNISGRRYPRESQNE
jgi:hypothetical protein